MPVAPVADEFLAMKPFTSLATPVKASANTAFVPLPHFTGPVAVPRGWGLVTAS